MYCTALYIYFTLFYYVFKKAFYRNIEIKKYGTLCKQTRIYFIYCLLNDKNEKKALKKGLV